MIEFLRRNYSLAEFKDLCLELAEAIDYPLRYDSVEGESFEAKTRELVTMIGRRGWWEWFMPLIGVEPDPIFTRIQTIIKVGGEWIPSLVPLLQVDGYQITEKVLMNPANAWRSIGMGPLALIRVFSGRWPFSEAASQSIKKFWYSVHGSITLFGESDAVVQPHLKQLGDSSFAYIVEALLPMAPTYRKMWASQHPSDYALQDYIAPPVQPVAPQQYYGSTTFNNSGVKAGGDINQSAGNMTVSPAQTDEEYVRSMSEGAGSVSLGNTRVSGRVFDTFNVRAGNTELQMICLGVVNVLAGNCSGTVYGPPGSRMDENAGNNTAIHVKKSWAELAALVRFWNS